MAEPKPLQPRQCQAAALLGRGASQGDAAEEVSVSRRTVSEWLKRDDFRELVEAGRSAALDAQPTARATLEGALTALRPNGEADWPTRVAAARALVQADGPGRASEPALPELTITNPALLDFGGVPEVPSVAALYERWDGGEPTADEAADWTRLTFAEAS
ncbi:MAG TPA: hypothetical protein VHU86_01400 [Solirubrobacterales bacterium]|nr:hypothetical protein [Solirubrobacterales bacterium]